MSTNKREYDVFRDLINGNQVATLDSEKMVTCVLERVSATLGNVESRYYVLHEVRHTQAE